MNGRKNIPETENGKSVIRRDSGFTLIEIVVALLVLTIGLLGMAGLSIEVMKGNKSSNQISTATALAQDKMEELRGIGYEGMMNDDPTETKYFRKDLVPRNAQDNETRYRRDVVTADSTYDTNGNVTTNPDDLILTATKTVTVTVYWDLGDLSHNYVEIQMLFSR